MDKTVEQIYTNLTVNWKQLSNYTPDTESLDRLIAETLDFLLDFKLLLQPEILTAEQKLKLFDLFTIVVNGSQDANLIKRIQLMVRAEGWTSDPIALGLLSGKAVKQSGPVIVDKELKLNLLQEANEFLECRIGKIAEFYTKTENKLAYQMALNFFDSHKKILLTDCAYQNQISYKCLQKILQNLLICLCHLQMFEHLNSLIVVLPESEKIRILTNFQSDYDISKQFTKLSKAKSITVIEIIKNLLRDECRKSRNDQNIFKFNLLIQFLLDFCKIDSFICSNLSNIIMSALQVSVHVDSNFFYMAAHSIREKLENQHSKLVLQLYITGLSFTLSFYNEMKFDKTLDENHFLEAHNKIFQVLIVLSFLISDSSIKRQCVRVANIFESRYTQISDRLIEYLDNGLFPGEGVLYETKKDLLNELQMLLGNFDREVKSKMKMDDRITLNLAASFDKFAYFGKKRDERNNSSQNPGVYPGIEEGYLKRGNRKETVAKKAETATKNYTEIHSTNTSFLARISGMFKEIKDPEIDPVEDRNKKNRYTSTQVRDFYLSETSMCPRFYVKNENLFFNLDKIAVNEIQNYKQYTERLIQEKLDKSQAILNHDFSTYKPFSYDFQPTFYLEQIYEEGKIDVWQLISNGFNFFDVSNILFLSILHKKSKFEENFASINLNRDKDFSHMMKVEQVFNYMLFKGQPEGSRLYPTVVKNYQSMMDFNADVYTYEINEFNKFKFSKYKVMDQGDRDEDSAEKILVVKPEKRPIPEGINQIEMIKKNLKIIQESLSKLLNKQFNIEFKNLDKIQAIFVEQPLKKSEISAIVLQKNHREPRRNCEQKISIEILAPELVEGSFVAQLDEIHEVAYTEKLQPFLRTTINLKKVCGNLVFFNSLNNFRTDLSVRTEDTITKGKIKISSQLDPALESLKPTKKFKKEKDAKVASEIE